MTQNKPLHVIVDNREQKLMALLDKKKDVITYESKQLDIALGAFLEKIGMASFTCSR